jgi:hypothetical protein
MAPFPRITTEAAELVPTCGRLLELPAVDGDRLTGGGPSLVPLEPAVFLNRWPVGSLRGPRVPSPAPSSAPPARPLLGRTRLFGHGGRPFRSSSASVGSSPTAHPTVQLTPQGDRCASARGRATPRPSRRPPASRPHAAPGRSWCGRSSVAHRPDAEVSQHRRVQGRGVTTTTTSASVVRSSRRRVRVLSPPRRRRR